VLPFWEYDFGAIQKGKLYMRIVLRILSVLLIVVGIIWILQGINVLPGSFMTGQIRWAYYGSGTAVAGLVILLLTRQRG
jgi:C4-dicarboxylate transporter